MVCGFVIVVVVVVVVVVPSVVVVVVKVMVMVVFVIGCGFGHPVTYQVPVSVVVVVVGDPMPYQVPLIVVVELAVEVLRAVRGSFVVLVRLLMRKSSKMRTMSSAKVFHELVVRRQVLHVSLLVGDPVTYQVPLQQCMKVRSVNRQVEVHRFAYG